MKHKYAATIMAGLVFLLLAGLVQAVNFTEPPSINNAQKPYLTTQDLECTWDAQGEDNHSIRWFKADSGQDLVHEPGFDNITMVPSVSTSRGNRWMCEVSLHNSTTTVFENSSVAHISPWLSFQNNNVSALVPQGLEVDEDDSYTFFINSANPDDAGVTFSLGAQNPSGVCTLVSPSTGEISCTPEHVHMAGTPNPAPESITNFTLVIREEVGTDSFGFTIELVLIPFNDQAFFITELDNQTIPAASPWSLPITAEDEETDYPLIFTLESDINDVFSGLLTITSTNDTAALITFSTDDGAPTNEHVGNWTVNVNVTDSFGSNESREADQQTFNLEITSTNFPPQFTSTLTGWSGTQNELFTFFVTANDSNVNDTLTFNVTEPTIAEHICPVAWPWVIETLNSSWENATGMINITLTNDHVACRWINLTVRDEFGGINSSLVFFNITNVNDPPIIHEISVDGNMSNQSTHLFATFNYQINASDPDELTYDWENTGLLTYFTNDSRFQVNPETGLVLFTPNNSSYIGLWSINYTVSDGEFNNSRIMNLEIVNNSAPILNLPSGLIFNQNDNPLLIEFNATDENDDNMSIEVVSLTDFNLSAYEPDIVSDVSDEGVRTIAWSINLAQANPRLANDQVGHHSLNITVIDEFGAKSDESSSILNFTIFNENDAPFFDLEKNNVSTSKPSLESHLGVIVRNRQVQKNFTATDYDLLLPSEFASESLTFSIVGQGPGITGASFIKVQDDKATLTFTPTLEGSSFITISVIDSQGANHTETLEFEVFIDSAPPVITDIKPYFNESTQTTIHDFIVKNLSLNKEFIEIKENTTVVFDALSVADEDVTNNTLRYEWYFNGNLMETLEDVEPGTDSNFSHYFNFFSAGTHEVKLRVVDLRHSESNFSWDVFVENVNRPPVFFNGSMEDLQVNITSEFVDYFSYRFHPGQEQFTQRFYDPDDDLNEDGIRHLGQGELTSLSYSLASNCGAADFIIQGDNLRIIPRVVAQCVVRFNATDPEGEWVISDEVTIDIIGIVEQQDSSSTGGSSSTDTRTITIPFDQEVDRPVPLKIIAPQAVATYVNRTIEIPLRLENTWNEAIEGISLRGVALNATFAGEEEAVIEFTRSEFPLIPVNGVEESTVVISNFRSDGPYEIMIEAHVVDPEYTDSVTILINALERTSEGDEVLSRVTFARELISENQECEELNELLNRAEDALNRGDYSEALNIVNVAINGCRYMISEANMRRERPGTVTAGLSVVRNYSNQILLGAGILTLLTILFYVFAAVKDRLASLPKKK